MQTIIKILTTIAVVMMMFFLTMLAVEVIKAAIMQNATVSQVMAQDFDMERVMVEASE